MQATGSGRPVRRPRAALMRVLRRDAPIVAIAALVFLAGFAMRPVTGHRPDWAIVISVSRQILPIGVALLCAGLVLRFLWLAAVARSRRPARELLRPLAAMLDPERAAGAAVGLAAVVMFAGGFAVLKGAIAIVAPFAWDAPLAGLDRLVHLGRYPHEWLGPLVARPWVLSLVNAAYNLWFFAVWTTLMVAACAPAGRLRQRYLVSFMLTWSVGGFLIALAFSSAGPVYFERLGLGDAYAPLMAELHAAAAETRLRALETQEALWQGFTGARAGSAGISAFPSMHVASATLFVLAARRIGRGLLAAALLYWLAIMLGSVLLGWHYAVDGYAGAAIALLAWRAAGRHRRAGTPLPAVG